jgi:Protein of unknown function (DUF3037)
MAEEPRNMYRYQVLRYTPNLIRDEWVNIGILLEELHDDDSRRVSRRAVRLIEQQSEFARVKRLHPDADEELLRGLPGDFDSHLRASGGEAEIEKLDQTLSNALQFSLPKAVNGFDFDAEMDRLFHEHVAVPPRARSGILESTRSWIKQRINDVFLRRRVPKLERNILVEEFTEPGDSLRLDYGYRNGVRGYVHAVALGRDPAQPKILAYTAQRIRARIAQCEFTAVTEVEPSPGNKRHEFILRLFADEDISLVPLSRVERFAEDLRLKLQ